MGNYGIRWENGYWVLHILWMEPLGQRRWCSNSRMLKRRSRSLDRLLAGMTGVEAVMLFPTCSHMPSQQCAMPVPPQSRQMTGGGC
jgi:hypothetical protein